MRQISEVSKTSDVSLTHLASNPIAPLQVQGALKICRILPAPPFDCAQGRHFDCAQGRHSDCTQGRHFDFEPAASEPEIILGETMHGIFAVIVEELLVFCVHAAVEFS